MLIRSGLRTPEGRATFSLGVLAILVTGFLFILAPVASGNSGSNCTQGRHGYCSTTSTATTSSTSTQTKTCTRTVSSASTGSSESVSTVTVSETQTVTTTAPAQTVVESQTLTQAGSTLTITESGATETQTMTQTGLSATVTIYQTVTETTGSATVVTATEVLTETLPGRTEIVTQPESIETVTEPGSTATILVDQGGGIVTVTVKQPGPTTTEIQQVAITSRATMLQTVAVPYTVTATELLQPVTAISMHTNFVGSTLTFSHPPQVVTETSTITRMNTVAVQVPATNVLSSWIPWSLMLVALCIGVLAGYRVRRN